MPYFKNSELAYTHHVSDRTVRNWIALAKDGKLPLELETHGGYSYVSKTSGNIKIIEQHVAKNKTRKPRAALKVVTPKEEFYNLFTQAQVYDIVRNLEIHHEIPRQYNYFDSGATEWDEYVKHLDSEHSPNFFNCTVELLSENQHYLDSRLAKYKRVNVVDIGVGNAQPARSLLAHLLNQDKLGRYIAIDISPKMLQIAKQNITDWFDGRVDFEDYELDITHERFATILAEDYLNEEDGSTANLILLFGGTAGNLRNPDDMFRTINESMSTNDLFICLDKPEKAKMQPEWYKYETHSIKQSLAKRHRLVFDLLNIDDSLYDVEMDFDPQKHQRFTRARLKVALTLHFKFDVGERTVEFEKGETILLWRSWQMTAAGIHAQFERTGFYTIHSSQTEDHEYLLAIAQVKRD